MEGCTAAAGRRPCILLLLLKKQEEKHACTESVFDDEGKEREGQKLLAALWLLYCVVCFFCCCFFSVFLPHKARSLIVMRLEPHAAAAVLSSLRLSSSSTTDSGPLQAGEGRERERERERTHTVPHPILCLISRMSWIGCSRRKKKAKARQAAYLCIKGHAGSRGRMENESRCLFPAATTQPTAMSCAPRQQLVRGCLHATQCLHGLCSPPKQRRGSRFLLPCALFHLLRLSLAAGLAFHSQRYRDSAFQSCCPMCLWLGHLRCRLFRHVPCRCYHRRRRRHPAMLAH